MPMNPKEMIKHLQKNGNCSLSLERPEKRFRAGNT